MVTAREDLPRLTTSIQSLCDQFSIALARDPIDSNELINLMAIYESNFPIYTAYLETWDEKLDTAVEKSQLDIFGSAVKQLLALMNLMMKKLDMVEVH